MAVQITVTIPTFRRPDLLARCLDSLARQTASPSEYEVVVVDDGSGDGTAEVLASVASSWEGLRWESLPTNRGPAAARNRAVARAEGRWVLFLDDDMVAPEGLVAEHLRLLRDGDPHLGVLGLVEWWPGLEVTPFMRWLDVADMQFSFSSMAEGPVAPPSRAFYTCNVSLDRRLLLDVGGFDERFPYAAYEDTELAVRLAGAGFHLDYRPSALAWHARQFTLQEFAARMVKVGEAAVLLKRIRPELAGAVDLEGPRATGWRRMARRAALAAGPLLERSFARDRYYHQVVNSSFCKGVERGRAALVAGAQTSAPSAAGTDASRRSDADDSSRGRRVT